MCGSVVIFYYRVTVLERGSPHSVGLQECGKVLLPIVLIRSLHHVIYTADAQCEGSHCEP